MVILGVLHTNTCCRATITVPYGVAVYITLPYSAKFFNYGSFTPELNLQATSLKDTPELLHTSFRLVNAVGLHWCSIAQFTRILESKTSLEPVGSKCEYRLLNF